MKSTARFVLMLIGLGIMTVGLVGLYVAIVAEFVGFQVFRWLPNVPFGLSAICFVLSGWSLLRNMIEDDFEDAN